MRDLLALESLPREVGRRLPAAGRQHQQRLRQHRRSPVRLAEQHGALPGRGAEDQPARRWRSVDAGDGEHSPARSRASAGRARGRTAIRHARRHRDRSEFPVDGTYTVQVDVGNAQGHELEITVDGERVALRQLGGGGRGAPAVDAPPGQPDPCRPGSHASLGGAAGGAGQRSGCGCDGATGATGASGCGCGRGATGGRAGGRGRGAAGPLEFPLTLKAGPKLIGVAFVAAHRRARRGHAASAHAQPRHAAGNQQRDDQRAL